MRMALENMRKNLWRDQQGGLVAAEYLLMGTLLTLGLLAGIAAVQSSMLNRLHDLAKLIQPW